MTILKKFILLIAFLGCQLSLLADKLLEDGPSLRIKRIHSDGTLSLVLQDKDGRLIKSFILRENYVTPITITIAAPIPEASTTTSNAASRQYITSTSDVSPSHYRQLVLNPLHLILDKRSLEKKDAVLKSFALREMPSAWDTLVKLKVAVFEQDDKVKRFAQDLQAFGRNPQDEPKYIKTCENRYQLAQLLLNVYKKLEDSYIASQAYETSLGNKGYEATKKKTIEDGIREAEMASQRYEQLLKEK